MLEAMRPLPAHVVSGTGDVLAWNPGGLRLLAGMEDWPARQRNIARYVFLHPAARDLFDDWGNQVRGCVARLRALAGTDPDAPDLTRLAGELLLKSPEFARLWERYDVTVEVEGTTARVCGRFITDATVYGTRANWRLQMTMDYAREGDTWSVVRSAATTW